MQAKGHGEKYITALNARAEEITGEPVTREGKMWRMLTQLEKKVDDLTEEFNKIKNVPAPALKKKPAEPKHLKIISLKKTPQ